MKKWYASTFLRYFISYFIMMLVLLIGFLIMLNSQLARTYTEKLSEDVEQRLDIIQEQLSANLISVMQVDLLLKNDISLLNYRYHANRSNYHQMHKLMSNLVDSNEFIEAITYLDKKNGEVISTKYIMKYENDICELYANNERYKDFDLREAEEKENTTLFFLEGDCSLCFLYLPNKVRDDYTIIYSLDTNALNKLMKGNMISGMGALVLFNREEACVYGIHAEKMGTDSSAFPESSGIYPWNEEHLLYVHANAYEDYSLAALISKQYIADQTHNAMSVAYLFLAGISLTGLMLIFLSMKLTYFPLAKLFRAVVPNPEITENYIDQMATIFADATAEINLLQEKINKYHVSIQKSLLDSSIEDNKKSSLGNIQNIDQVFRSDCENCIYVLRISSESRTFSDDVVQQLLLNRLSDENDFIVLESESNYRVLIVNYMEQIADKEAEMCHLLTELHEETGYLCALSNSATSLIDIPTLYEHSLLASGCWSDVPVAIYSRISDEQFKQDEAVYPYRLLSLLGDSLDRLDFTESEVLLKKLLMEIERMHIGVLKYPEFMIRCLMIDILITLFDAMNRHNVRYDTYKDLYYETLYYCRSCSWQEKKEDITGGLHQLLELFRIEQTRIRAHQIQEYLEQNYASPELGVSSLADYFHVNSVYMSYVIKKELGDTFVNYLWKIRLRKATELLLHTDLPVESISVLVGYENSTSFRRKFKQEMGMTPTEYRKK